MHTPSTTKHNLAPLLLLLPLLFLPLFFWEQQAKQGVNFDGVSFSHATGVYEQDILLTLKTAVPNANIYFTLDGRFPTPTASTRYQKPIPLSANPTQVVVLRTAVLHPNGHLSDETTATYILGTEPGLSSNIPIISLIVEPDDLWDSEAGIYANPLERGSDWERQADVTIFDAENIWQQSAGVRIHGRFTRTYDKKSFRLYFRQEYGTNRLSHPLFGTNHTTTFKRLVLHSGSQDSSGANENWTLLRNQLISQLAQEIGLPTAQSRPVLLFLNGQPWGIYQLRERIDRFFLDDNLGSADIDLLDTPDLLEHAVIDEGDRAHWDALIDYIDTHDMRQQAAYDYVQTQVDLDNFIDYLILQIYVANADWPHHNVDQFRGRTAGGKWQWIIWDSDMSLGHQFRSQPDIDLMPTLLIADHPFSGGRTTIFVRKMMSNLQFREQLLQRTDTLLNTTLAPAKVQSQIDELAQILAPNIAHEVSRWPSHHNWETSVESMRHFVNERPFYMRQHLIDFLGLAGTATLTGLPPLEGKGWVAIDGQSSIIWNGTHFQQIPIQITAVPANGYRFAGWESGIVETAVFTTTLSDNLTIQPRFEPIPPHEPHPHSVIFREIGVDDNGRIQGDWIELEIVHPTPIDMRGWRLTDNDTKNGRDEGSLILPNHPALANVPSGTRILIIATESSENGRQFPNDQFTGNQWLLYAGNGNLDTTTDPHFNLSKNDNLVLLADNIGIAFYSNASITPHTFGILSDGISK